MDELRIKSEFMKKFIAGAIRRSVKKKLGYDVDVRFNDDILLQITDAGAHLCFNADIDMNNEDLTKLRRNVIGL
jgi:hypothetical protein